VSPDGLQEPEEKMASASDSEIYEESNSSPIIDSSDEASDSNDEASDSSDEATDSSDEKDIEKATEPEASDEDAGSEVKEEPVSDTPQDAAAALLARLRGSQDLRASLTPPEPEPVAVVVEVEAPAPVVDDPMPPTADIETMPTPAKPSAPSPLSASGAQRAVFQVCLEG
jgi:hypothetical protein